MTTAAVPTLAEPRPVRLLSLDAFRGMVIATMFLVNVGGTDEAFRLGAWAPESWRSWMPHMGWNGGRMGNGLADYVFPWFLLIVGVAIPLSMSQGRGAGRPWASQMGSALRRGLILYLLGSLMWAATIGHKPTEPDAAWAGPIDWRILLHWDILPLIGLGYVVGVAVHRVPVWAQATMLTGVLVAKWYLLRAPVQEGMSWREALAAKTSLQQTLGTAWGLPGWWRTLLVQGSAFACLVVIGSLAGRVIVRHRNEPAVVPIRLALGGAVLCGVGICWWIMGDMPLSKDYVSPTYVLVTAGTGLMVFAGMFWCVDLKRSTTLAFFRVFGVNALAAYILAEWMWKTVLTRWQVVLPPAWGVQGDKPASAAAITAAKAWAAEAVGRTAGAYVVVAVYILAYWLVCLALDKRKVYIRV